MLCINLQRLVGINLLKEFENQVWNNSPQKYRNEDGEEIFINKQSQFDFLKYIDKEGVEDIMFYVHMSQLTIRKHTSILIVF